MIFENIEFHNVEELIKCEQGYAMQRIPNSLKSYVNEGIRNSTGLYSTGIELRFKAMEKEITLILKADEAMEASTAYIFYGSIQGGWMYSSKTIDTKETRIKIARPDNLTELKRVTDNSHLGFNPEVIRVVLPYNKCYFVGVEGKVVPPAKEDVPSVTYLAYGSSITHGSLALAAPYTYPFRIAQKMNCDYINLGFAGTAHLEKEMAQYIISRKDWTFASVELGINMISDAFTVEMFEDRVKEFVEILSEDHRKIFCTSIFYNNLPEQDKINKYREIVKKYAEGKLIFTDGLELLNRPYYISQDLVHPSLEGMEEIINNWYPIMSRHF